MQTKFFYQALGFLQEKLLSNGLFKARSSIDSFALKKKKKKRKNLISIKLYLKNIALP